MRPHISSAENLSGVDRAIVQRRTNLRMDPEREVEASVIQELCELACWAPNHRRTEPWRFAVFVGDGRLTLGTAIAAELDAIGSPAERVAKTRIKYLRAPAMLLIGSIRGVDDVETGENRDAVAAAIQNLLLAATERGLASFWSSVAAPTSESLLRLCGFPPGTYVAGAIYLGHPVADAMPPDRNDPIIEWVVSSPDQV